MCGGGSGKITMTALWMYNKLMRCLSVALLDHNKMLHFKDMKTRH